MIHIYDDVKTYREEFDTDTDIFTIVNDNNMIRSSYSKTYEKRKWSLSVEMRNRDWTRGRGRRLIWFHAKNKIERQKYF